MDILTELIGGVVVCLLAWALSRCLYGCWWGTPKD